MGLENTYHGYFLFGINRLPLIILFGSSSSRLTQGPCSHLNSLQNKLLLENSWNPLKKQSYPWILPLISFRKNVRLFHYFFPFSVGFSVNWNHGKQVSVVILEIFVIYFLKLCKLVDFMKLNRLWKLVYYYYIMHVKGNVRNLADCWFMKFNCLKCYFLAYATLIVVQTLTIL